MRFIHHIQELAASPYYRTRPLGALQYTYAKVQFARARVGRPEHFLRRLGIDPVHALSGFSNWKSMLLRVIESVQRESGVQGGISLEDGVILYAITRALRPQHAIETGVAAGVSTAFLGAALIENGRGDLYSIELPSGEEPQTLADGCTYDWPARGVGWALPKEIRLALGVRRNLILQDVRTALPSLLRRLGTVDLFFHDDLHTPDHMLWEYRLVWPHLSNGGFLLSDDAGFGWIRFCRQMGLAETALVNLQRLTAARKP